MTRKQLRSLIFKQVNTFDTSLANVYFENLEGSTVKGETWLRASLRFGQSSAVGLGQAEDIGVLFIQVFYKKDAGGSAKDVVIDALVGIFDYKTFTDSNGYLQFRGSTELVAPSDAEYNQVQYSIPFAHYKEIA